MKMQNRQKRKRKAKLKVSHNELNLEVKKDRKKSIQKMLSDSK